MDEALMALLRCPYDDCTYEADSQEALDDHIAYCTSFDDPEHTEDKRHR